MASITKPNSPQNHHFSPTIPISSPYRNVIAKTIENDTCFRCNSTGHWAKDCPTKTLIKSPSLISASDIPVTQCRCGAGVCTILTSKTGKNPNRKFYCCPGRQSGYDCGLFKWVDEMRSSQCEVVMMCPCGAGACSVHTEWNGPHAGRRYYKCRLKKGFGACNFFQWEGDHVNVNEQADLVKLDNYPNSSGNSNLVNDAAATDLGGNCSPSGDHPTKINFEPAGLDESPNAPNGLIVPEHLNEEIVTLVLSDDDSDEASDKSTLAELDETPDPPNVSVVPGHLNKEREPLIESDDDCDEESDNSTLTYIEDSLPIVATEKGSLVSNNEEVEMLDIETYLLMMNNAIRDFRPPSTAEIYLPTLKIWIRISSPRSPVGQFFGWCGRLAFPLPRSLIIPAPKPFFCGIFPSLDPIFIPHKLNNELVSRNSNTLSREANAENILTQTHHGHIARLSGGARLANSNRCYSNIIESNVITGSIMETFRHASVSIQNQLLTLLESMDPLDYKSMEREADSTFAALDRLIINYTAFRQRVEGFIQCASEIAELEQSIFYNPSPENIIEQYNSNKAIFDELSCTYTDAMKAYQASDEQLLLLHEEASQAKNKLLEIENQVSCFKTETSRLKDCLDAICEEKMEAERNLQIAEEALEVCQQREADWYLVKEAFEKAKDQLYH